VVFPAYSRLVGRETSEFVLARSLPCAARRRCDRIRVNCVRPAPRSGSYTIGGYVEAGWMLNTSLRRLVQILECTNGAALLRERAT